MWNLEFELAERLVAVVELLQVVREVRGQVSRLFGHDRHGEREEAADEAQEQQHDERDRRPARHVAAVEPQHERVEPDRDEEREQSRTSTWPATTTAHASTTAQATPSAPAKPTMNGCLRSNGVPTSPKAVSVLAPAWCLGAGTDVVEDLLGRLLLGQLGRDRLFLGAQPVTALWRTAPRDAIRLARRHTAALTRC